MGAHTRYRHFAPRRLGRYRCRKNLHVWLAQALQTRELRRRECFVAVAPSASRALAPESAYRARRRWSRHVGISARHGRRFCGVVFLEFERRSLKRGARYAAGDARRRFIRRPEARPAHRSRGRVRHARLGRSRGQCVDARVFSARGRRRARFDVRRAQRAEHKAAREDGRRGGVGEIRRHHRSGVGRPRKGRARECDVWSTVCIGKIRVIAGHGAIREGCFRASSGCAVEANLRAIGDLGRESRR